MSSDQNTINSAGLPGPRVSNSTSGVSFASGTVFDDTVVSANAAPLSDGAARCCAYKRDSKIRCSKAAFPGLWFCSQDHRDWDTKANGTTHCIWSKDDTCNECTPTNSSDKPEGNSNPQSSHSGDKPISTSSQELIGPLKGFASIITEPIDLTKPKSGRVASSEERKYACLVTLGIKSLSPHSKISGSSSLLKS